MAEQTYRTAADLPATLDCGHAPQPSFWGDGSTYTIPATGEVMDMTGRVLFPGYATLLDGRRVCPDCADAMQRAQLAALTHGERFAAYLSSDSHNITTWTGGVLARVTRVTSNGRQTFVRATTADGSHLAGIGPAESGTYVSLRRVKGDAR